MCASAGGAQPWEGEPAPGSPWGRRRPAAVANGRCPACPGAAATAGRGSGGRAGGPSAGRPSRNGTARTAGRPRSAPLSLGRPRAPSRAPARTWCAKAGCPSRTVRSRASPARDLAREGDLSGPGRAHRLARVGGEIDTAMPRRPRRRGRFPGPYDHRARRCARPGHRPGASALVGGVRRWSSSGDGPGVGRRARGRGMRAHCAGVRRAEGHAEGHEDAEQGRGRGRRQSAHGRTVA